MRHAMAIALSCVIFLTSGVAGAAPKFKSEDDKTLYAIGVSLSRNLKTFNLTPAETELVNQGFADGALGKAGDFKTEEYTDKIRELGASRVKITVERERAAGKVYSDKAAAEPGATRTASGLVFKSTQAGTGESPKATDTVKVNYEGRAVDGKVFDSSARTGQPVTFPLNRVIPCWTEAVQLMKVGGKATIVCPADLAYGDQGRPGILPGATLIFDVELLEIMAASKPPAPASAPPPAAPAAKPAAPAKPK